MKILKVNSKNPEKKVIEKAVKILRAGGVIVYPTETSYGIGGDATQKKAVARIFKIKQRSRQKSMTIIVSSLAMAKDYVKFDKLSWQLAKKYWPGPLTLVLPKNKKKKKKKIYTDLTGRNFDFGIRVSPQPVALMIVKKLRRPLVSTSANISGQEPSYQISEILKQFKNKKNQPELILDAGKLPKRLTSTVVLIKDGKIVVLREGPIKIKKSQSSLRMD